MTGDIDRLRQYLAENESRQLEFKRATTQFDSAKLMRYCCALSCEGGGKMVFGVSDDKQVVGTQAFADPAKTERDIYNRIGLRCTFEMLQADGKRVLILHIPRSVVGHPTSYEGQYWMRSGESLEPMSPERLRELLNEGVPSYLDENEPGTHSWDEIKLLLAVERYYELIGSRMPGEETQIRDFLRMHFVERTAFDASARSLNDFPDVEHHTIRVMRLRGTSIADMVFDRVYSKGYAVVFDDVIEQINALLPVDEDFAGGLRDEQRDFSPIAVREIVANACVHQDFTEHGGIDITISSQRITVSNPGIPRYRPIVSSTRCTSATKVCPRRCESSVFARKGEAASTGLWKTSRNSRPTRRNSSSRHAAPPSSCAKDVSRTWA